MAVIDVTLQYVKQSGNYMVGRDTTGFERWFDTRKCRVNVIDTSSFSVKIKEKDWMRRLEKSQEVREVLPTKNRKCLCCKTPFEAERLIYVCTPCKQTPDWQDGSTIFDPV